jgi:hypothetical protein
MCHINGHRRVNWDNARPWVVHEERQELANLVHLFEGFVRRLEVVFCGELNMVLRQLIVLGLFFGRQNAGRYI